MNPIIITVVIATATFILSIFGALQFYSSRMEKYIDAKIDGVDVKIDGLRSEMRSEFNGLRGEIGGLRGEINAR